MKIKLIIIICDCNNFKHYYKVVYINGRDEYIRLYNFVVGLGGYSTAMDLKGGFVLTIYEPKLKKALRLIWEAKIHEAFDIKAGDLYKMPVCAGNPVYQALFTAILFEILIALCGKGTRKEIAEIHNMSEESLKKLITEVYRIVNLNHKDRYSKIDDRDVLKQLMIEYKIFVDSSCITCKRPF
jgi:hypothetical protein